MKYHITVLASGSGTTAEAFIEAGQRGEIQTDISLVICNRKDAGIFERIKQLNKNYNLNIECVLINSKTHPAADHEIMQPGCQTKAEEAAILKLLKRTPFDLIVQMGYMKRTGPAIVQEFGWRPTYESIYEARMLNTHPGLLPDTQGLYGELVQQYVLKNHLPYAGQTLHIVAKNYDDGPIIAEHSIAVKSGDTPKSLFSRVQKLEKEMLPKDIQNFILARETYYKQIKED